MAEKFKIKGAKEVKRNMVKLSTKYPAFAAAALNAETETTLVEAKELTPVESGDLKRSATIWKTATPVSLETVIVYGKQYALAVHEIPAPPQKSPGGRSADHQPHLGSGGKSVGQGGQWKYLSTAINQRAQKFAARIASGIGTRAKALKLATGK